LAYRCYREIRLGDDSSPPWSGDKRSKQCAKLKEPDMSEMYQQALTRPAKEALNPFIARTGFQLHELPLLFSQPQWKRGYGGARWVEIATHAVRLGEAMNTGSSEVTVLVQGAYDLRHNDRTRSLIGDGKGVQLKMPCCINLAGRPDDRA
jgi:hypothetical protein